jgi:phosphoribosylanthranilate isomerase
MTYVKICGLQQSKHVKAAVEAGADFIGFVFAPSKRQITLEQAIQLAEHIPPHVKKVGVFVNEKPERIHTIFEKVGLDFVQYHGDECKEEILQIGLPSIKAFSIDSQTDFLAIEQYEVDYYLFDAPGAEYRGGSGHTFNWAILEQMNIPRNKVFLAGGLRSENVQQAIQQVQPFAVDVSSSVETDHVKDVHKIKQFIDATKGVNSYDN